MNEALIALQAEVSATQALVSGDLQKNASDAVALINTPDPNADQVVAITSQVSSLKASIKTVSDQLAAAVSPATPVPTV